MNDNLKEIWKKISNDIKEEISNLSFETWIRRINPLRIDENDNSIYLEVCDNTHLDKAMEFKPLIETAFRLYLKKEYQVQFFIKGNEIPSKEKNVLDNNKSKKVNLNPNYTFENFIVGSSNEMAYSACLNIAQNAHLSNFENTFIYNNPLFLYGGSGLGKTHLINAIGNYIIQNFPNLNILYISTEDFVNEFINTIRVNDYTKFRTKFRNVDVLLVDDIQFIEGKEQMQIEFFHTFETLYTNNSKIILTCDKSPNNLKTLEERLKSRFSSGLTVDIQSPDYETRLAILRSKNLLSRQKISDDILVYIAQNVSNNVRELEGSFKTVSAYASMHSNFTLDIAKMILKDKFDSNNIKKLSPEFILEIVSTYYSISKEDIMSSKRKKQFALPRQIVMYLCRDELDLTFQQIGKIFEKDHSTVMHSCSKIESELINNSKMKLEIDEIRKRISS